LTPGNVELVDVVCSMTVWTGGVALVLWLDERHLPREALARDWLPATRDATVLGAFLFGVLYAGPALLTHFLKTRRSLLGLLLGVAVPAALLAADFGAQLGAEAIIDLSGW
jgi:hypothetical protein